jgi:enoyl-CoA hydratase/carnithine racemase
VSSSERPDLVLYEVSDAVATISFNRPDRRNSWSHEMEAQYFRALDRASDDRHVRSIVVTGTGKWFCPGMDTTGLEEIASGSPIVVEGRLPQWYPWSVPKPMIAAINGACAGIGLTQALFCDIRFAARGSKFTTAFARRGMIAEYGSSWLLPRLVGVEAALDLLLSGRTFDSEEALRLRMVSRVTEPQDLLAEAHDYAAELATNCSPLSMAIIRRQVLEDMQTTFESATERGARLMLSSTGSGDFAEGIASFVEKRSPNFEALPEGFCVETYLED